MLEARIASAVGFIVLAVFIVRLRKRLFARSALAAFALTNIITSIFGVLVYPWAHFAIQEWFYNWQRLGVITAIDVTRAIVLTLGGLLITVGTYIFFSRKGESLGVISGPSRFQPGQEPPLGFHMDRAVVLSMLAMLATGVFLYLNLSTIRMGIELGAQGGDLAMLYEGRRQITSTYLFVVLSYNVVPFLSVAVWVAAMRSHSGLLRAYALAYAVATCIVLLLTFQKRPLIVYLGCLFFADLWIRQWREGISHQSERDRPRKHHLRVLIFGAAVMAILFGLYWTFTGFAFYDGTTSELLGDLTVVVLVRIFGRLAMPCLMYAHFYPHLHAHYGLTNLGIFATLFQTDLHADTAVVNRYFTGLGDQGTVAITALVDFYGGFGWVGWIIGCILLGILLLKVDQYLSRIRPSYGKFLIATWVLVSVFYLSQASLPRTLMGYGGVFFAGLWFLITAEIGESSRRSASPHKQLRNAAPSESQAG